MQIGSITSSIAAMQMRQSGNNVPASQVETGSVQDKKSPLQEFAESLDPRDMSWQESMDLANALMKSGKGDLSTAFLPPPLFEN